MNQTREAFTVSATCSQMSHRITVFYEKKTARLGYIPLLFKDSDGTKSVSCSTYYRVDRHPSDSIPAANAPHDSIRTRPPRIDECKNSLHSGSISNRMARCSSRLILLLKESSFQFPDQFDRIELSVFTCFVNDRISMSIATGSIQFRLKEIREHILGSMFSSEMNGQLSLVISN